MVWVWVVVTEAQEDVQDNQVVYGFAILMHSRQQPLVMELIFLQQLLVTEHIVSLRLVQSPSETLDKLSHKASRRPLGVL